MNKLARWNDPILYRSVFHFPWQYNFIWCFLVNNRKGVTGFLPILWMVADGFGRWWFDPGEHPYAHEANLLFSMISGDNLNFFTFQLLHYLLETCLICSPTMKRQEVQKNFIRFGSSSSVFILTRHLNIACLLFKYFDLTVEAYMDNSVTLLFGREDRLEFNHGSPLYYRRGGPQTKSSCLDEG